MCGVDSGVIMYRVVENVIRRMEAIYGPSFAPLEGKMSSSYRSKHLLYLFFSLLGAN